MFGEFGNIQIMHLKLDKKISQMNSRLHTLKALPLKITFGSAYEVFSAGLVVLIISRYFIRFIVVVILYIKRNVCVCVCVCVLVFYFVHLFLYRILVIFKN